MDIPVKKTFFFGVFGRSFFDGGLWLVFFGMPGPWTIVWSYQTWNLWTLLARWFSDFFYRRVTRNLQVASWASHRSFDFEVGSNTLAFSFQPYVGSGGTNSYVGHQTSGFILQNPKFASPFLGFTPGNWRLEPKKTWWFGSMLTSFSKEICSGSILKFSGCNPPHHPEKVRKNEISSQPCMFIQRWNETRPRNFVKRKSSLHLTVARRCANEVDSAEF